jgi:large subunit ribosomal protein L20
MPRVKRGQIKHKRHKKILKEARGYQGRRSKLYRSAKQQLIRSLAFSYRDRKQRKREFRRLWITRISAAVKPHGLNYSRFIKGLTKANVEINRKMLSNIAIEDPDAFKAIVEVAKQNQ